MDDSELLLEYSTNRSETAFAELVRRHVDFVYSSALRQLGGNHHLAQDVTQMVFVDVARKSSALSRHPSLFAWLHRCTRYAVFNLRRKEARRGALNQALANEPPSTQTPEPSWREIAPVLDEVVDALPEKDRAAVLHRFFTRKPFAELGRDLGVTENAARMRVDRALKAMRAALGRRGIHSSAAVLGALVGENSVGAAPVGVLPSVSAAIANTSAPLSPLVSTVLTMGKVKAIITTVLVATSAIGLFFEFQSRNKLRAEFSRLQGVGAELDEANRENASLHHELHTMAATNPEADGLTHVLSRIALVKARPAGVTDDRMKPIASAGRATPEAAHATFLAAVNAGDLATVQRLMTFRDGVSDQIRVAFMANFNDAVRHRYSTPEQVFAAAYLGLVEGASPPSMGTSYQDFDSEVTMPGVARDRFWVAGPNGEHEDREYFEQTQEGWSVVFRPLTSRTAAELQRLLDPVTGLPKPKQP